MRGEDSESQRIIDVLCVYVYIIRMRSAVDTCMYSCSPIMMFL